MNTASPAPRWTKEIRAIGPFVLGPAALWIIAVWQREFDMRGAVPIAAALSAIAIGAFSMGGEYANRTLVALLSQPESRAALWIRKRAIAIAGVAIVLGTGWLAMQALPQHPTDTNAELVTEFLVSGLCALSIAPMLSLAGRSPLFGLVLSVAFIAGAWSIGSIGAYTKFGPLLSSSRSASDWTVAFVWWVSVPCCAAGLVADWILFQRLQAIDGAPLALFPSSRSARVTPVARTDRRLNQPWWPLMQKELRLQQIVLLGPIFFLGLWFAAVVSVELGAKTFASLFDAFSLGYVVLFAGLVGGLAGAEEKQLGTHQSQLLMPVSARTQFLVKLGVALAVTVAGTLPVCALNLWGLPAEDHSFVTFGLPLFASAITLWTFYVATLCATSIRALVIGAPLGFLIVTALEMMALFIARLRQPRLRSAAWVQAFVQTYVTGHHELGAVLICASLVVLPIAYLASRNFRWPDLRVAQIVIQVLAIACAAEIAMQFWVFVWINFI